MKYDVRHEMTDLNRVHTVIEKAYESYQTRLADYKPSLKWTGEHEATVDFTVMSKKIEARFTIDEEMIHMEGEIPLIFKPFKGKIEKVVAGEIDVWLEKARNGEI